MNYELLPFAMRPLRFGLDIIVIFRIGGKGNVLHSGSKNLSSSDPESTFSRQTSSAESPVNNRFFLGLGGSTFIGLACLHSRKLI